MAQSWFCGSTHSYNILHNNVHHSNANTLRLPIQTHNTSHAGHFLTHMSLLLSLTLT